MIEKKYYFTRNATYFFFSRFLFINSDKESSTRFISFFWRIGNTKTLTLKCGLGTYILSMIGSRSENNEIHASNQDSVECEREIRERKHVLKPGKLGEGHTQV